MGVEEGCGDVGFRSFFFFFFVMSSGLPAGSGVLASQGDQKKVNFFFSRLVVWCVALTLTLRYVTLRYVTLRYVTLRYVTRLYAPLRTLSGHSLAYCISSHVPHLCGIRKNMSGR